MDDDSSQFAVDCSSSAGEDFAIAPKIKSIFYSPKPSLLVQVVYDFRITIGVMIILLIQELIFFLLNMNRVIFFQSETENSNTRLFVTVLRYYSMYNKCSPW